MSEAKRSPRRTVNPSDVTRNSGELEIAWMLGARGDGRAMGGGGVATCGRAMMRSRLRKVNKKNPGRPKTEISRPCLAIVALCARRCPGNAVGNARTRYIYIYSFLPLVAQNKRKCVFGNRLERVFISSL